MLNRKEIFKQFKWLQDSSRYFVISANYDGLICASFLSHFLKWKLAGYYNMEKIWISEEGIKNKKSLIWVDLDILPTAGRTLGGHIVKLKDSLPKGYNNSCNPNILLNLSNNDFKSKYPLSTLTFLMWLFNASIPKTLYGQFLILHSDAIWLKYQKYSKNFSYWLELLNDYSWDKLFKNIDTLSYEKKVDQVFYPDLIKAGAISGFSKLSSKHLKIKSRESKFNPDWDEDVILNLLEFFAEHLSWNPLILPKITKKIAGKKYSVNINQVNQTGLEKFIKNKKIFSYAITSPKVIKYTVFEKIK